MEKLMVIAGIWALCVLCIVMFMRGATAPTTRRLIPARVKTGETVTHAEQQ